MGAKASKAKQAKDRQGKLDKLAKNMDAAKKLLSGDRYQPKLKIAEPPPCGELPLALIGATLRHEQGTQNIMEGASLRIAKGMRLIIRGALLFVVFVLSHNLVRMQPEPELLLAAGS
jgi:ATPase subunit of ABC transporter with duplicated ATPase domains